MDNLVINSQNFTKRIFFNFITIFFFLVAFQIIPLSASEHKSNSNNLQEGIKIITEESVNDLTKTINGLENLFKLVIPTDVLEKGKNIYHHLGIYCFKQETLKDFVSYNQSSNEIRDRLEQLRALDNNIRINVALAKSSPIGVDTEEDFLAIKKIMEYKP